jgi:1-acyl-sn-glycerol-3-phosphate acyltransferase
MAYWFIQIVVGILARFLFRLEIRGRHYIPKNGPFILASNHRSNLDPVILAVCTDRKLFFLAKAELFENAISNAILKKVNCIELKRFGEDKAALKKGLRALRNGKGLLLFPEGTRSRNNKLGSGKTGLSLFAFTAKCPVVPVFISGTQKALPIGTRFIHVSTIRVLFGKPMEAKKNVIRTDRKEEYQIFVDKVMRSIADLEKKAT